MRAPRISVAMTTYNGAPYVDEQLASFCSQTRLPDELVICDDGSTDGTIEKIQAFASRAPFEVRVECNPTNLTTTPNFEKVVSLCSGEFVFLADQDDIWRPHKIKTQADFLEQHPQVGAVFSNGRVVNEKLEAIGYELWDSLWFSRGEREKVKSGRGAEVFIRHVVAAGTTLAIRSEYRDVYLPFPLLHDCHDAWLTFSIAGVAEVRIIEENLIDYRLHGENQFGLQRFNLREQLAKAREQLEIGAFRHNVEFFTAARDRFVDAQARGFEIDPKVLALAEGKIAHARRRDQMSSHFFARLPTIAAEVLKRGYWRYGYGFKSLAQDLLLR